VSFHCSLSLLLTTVLNSACLLARSPVYVVAWTGGAWMVMGKVYQCSPVKGHGADAPYRLRSCKNRACSVSWPKVAKGIQYPIMVSIVLLARTVFFSFSFVFKVYFCFVALFMVVSTSAVNCLERLRYDLLCLEYDTLTHHADLS